MNKTKLLDEADFIYEQSFVIGESLPARLSSHEIWVIAAIACAPIAVMVISVLVVSIFQVRMVGGTWIHVWKVFMKRIGLLSATSSPP